MSAEMFLVGSVSLVVAVGSFGALAVILGAMPKIGKTFYIVGCVSKKVTNLSEDPQWHVISLRWRFKTALKECMQSDAYFYIPIKLGRLPSSAQAVFPRR